MKKRTVFSLLIFILLSVFSHFPISLLPYLPVSPSSCFAQEQMAGVTILGGSTPVASCADSSCSGFIVCQNFEDAGYDNGETWTTAAGTPDPDYATSPCPLRGSQSLRTTSGACMAYINYASQDEIYFFLRFYYTGTSGRFVWLNNGGTDDAYIKADASGTLIFQHGTNWATVSASINTLHFIWGHYKKSTGGSNGIYQLWISTTKTKPGSPSIDGSNGSSTGATARFGVGVLASTAYYDQILVSTTAIGDVCD